MFTLKDLVKLTVFPYYFARIVELRGALGPNGCQVYKIQILNCSSMFVEVCDYQIEKTQNS